MSYTDNILDEIMHLKLHEREEGAAEERGKIIVFISKLIATNRPTSLMDLRQLIKNRSHQRP